MNKDHFKRITAQMLRFPTYLKFTSHDNGLLICQGKRVQVVASEPVGSNDYPPVDFDVFGIGKCKFILSEADVIILSFVNVKTKQTDCAVIQRDKLLSRLKDYHSDGDKINIKLILSERGLHECYNAGGEGFFLHIWTNRNFTTYHNNWLVFWH